MVDVPPSRHVAALSDAGVPGPVAEILAEMFAGIAAGILLPRGDRAVSMPTSLEVTLGEARP